jgi:hypothetical protein
MALSKKKHKRFASTARHRLFLGVLLALSSNSCAIDPSMPSGNFLVEKGWPRGPTRPAVAEKGGGQQGGQSGA